MSTTTGRSAFLFFLFCLFLFLSSNLSAQPANDDAASPMLLTVDTLCLSPAAATLDGATSSGVAAAGCAFGPNAGGPADVWFVFTAPTTAANISLELGEFSSLMFAGEIYTAGATPAFVECFMGFGSLVTNYSTENLTPGQTYLLRVYDDGTMVPMPEDPLDFFVCMNFLPNLEVGFTFGENCNDAVDIPGFTGSGDWKYLTINGGLAIGILDSEAIPLTAASLYSDFTAPTTTGPFGVLLTRAFGLAANTPPVGPLRIRLFITVEELNAFLSGGFSANELLLHRYAELSCSSTPPAIGIPELSAPLGFGIVGQHTVYLEYEVEDLSAFFLGEGELGLPVSWSTLSGRAERKNNVIKWGTMREINTDYFAVERSETGQTWEVIGELSASGNTTSERIYTTIDERPLTQAFYRVRQYDLDGRSTVSSIIELQRDIVAESIYPNPATDVITLPFAGELRVLDWQGRQYLHRSNQAQHMSVSDLPAGLYWLELRSWDTDKVLRTKLMKQ